GNAAPEFPVNELCAQENQQRGKSENGLLSSRGRKERTRLFQLVSGSVNHHQADNDQADDDRNADPVKSLHVNSAGVYSYNKNSSSFSTSVTGMACGKSARTFWI